MSKQHVLPDRIKALVPREGTKHRGRHTYSEGVAPFAPTKTRAIERSGALGTRKHRTVCTDCNSGWMNTAEQAAFEVITPLIRGSGMSLIGPKEAEKIALLAGIILPMVARDHAPTNAICQDERSYIFEQRRLPENWSVFCGKIDSKRWTFRTQHRAFTMSTIVPISRDTPKNAQVSTIGIGHFLLHSVSCHHTKIVTNPQHYAASLGLIPIHPAAQSIIDWAHLPALNDAQIEQVGGEIARIGEMRAWKNAGLSA